MATGRGPQDNKVKKPEPCIPTRFENAGNKNCKNEKECVIKMVTLKTNTQAKK